eukprot:TRINITY_DN3357_c0_g1_i7.p4 TRINITY_DN3357_c0_g1~~TRINITY_DN3357_c0_g1_i7.p4  ORF type:complete len:300 (+),score=69.16 TRINITY_DN3357_c0_g1_i7:1121-2020(+)
MAKEDEGKTRRNAEGIEEARDEPAEAASAVAAGKHSDKPDAAEEGASAEPTPPENGRPADGEPTICCEADLYRADTESMTPCAAEAMEPPGAHEAACGGDAADDAAESVPEQEGVKEKLAAEPADEAEAGKTCVSARIEIAVSLNCARDVAAGADSAPAADSPAVKAIAEAALLAKQPFVCTHLSGAAGCADTVAAAAKAVNELVGVPTLLASKGADKVALSACMLKRQGDKGALAADRLLMSVCGHADVEGWAVGTPTEAHASAMAYEDLEAAPPRSVASIATKAIELGAEWLAGRAH